MKYRLLSTLLSDNILLNLRRKIELSFYTYQNYNITSHLFLNFKKRLKKNHKSSEFIEIRELLKNTLTNYEIIEVHNIMGSERVLVRSIDSLIGEANVCFVLDLDNLLVVTCYFNCSNDKHMTIDMSNYFGSYPVTKYIN